MLNFSYNIVNFITNEKKIPSQATKPLGTAMDSPNGRAETDDFSGDEAKRSDKNSNIIDKQRHILAI